MWYPNLASSSGGVSSASVWTAILLASATAIATPIGPSDTTMSTLTKRQVWDAKQESEEMCYWKGARSALVKDKIYIDGGELAFTRRQRGGGELSKDTLPRDVVYELDLTRPFSYVTSPPVNTSEVLAVTRTKESIDVDVRGGAIFSTDDQLLFFGGDPFDTDARAAYPGKYQISRFQLDKQSFEMTSLPRDLSRFITSGAYANVPGEKLGFLFGGLRNKEEGEEIRHGAREVYYASELSNKFITVDMTKYKDEKWTSETPKEVAPRYDATLTWVPRGAKGSLVLIGGVIDGLLLENLDHSVPDRNDTVIENAQKAGAKFMTELPIYDIDAKKWYIQKTNGTPPPPLSLHCAVHAQSKDKETDVIYVMGGYAGIKTTDIISSAVYALSLPTFTWVKVSEGDKDVARHSQQCHRVSGNRILSIGGYPENAGISGPCLRGGFIISYDMNKCEYDTHYTPKNHGDYEVPAVIQDAIPSSPSPTIISAVKKLMDTEYTKPIPASYPYNAGIPIGSLTKEEDIKKDDEKEASGGGGGGGLPKYIPPLIGTLLGLLVLIIILCAALFWIRRKKSKGARTVTEGSTVRRNRQTWSWLLGVYGNEKGQYAHSQEDIDYAGPVESDNGMFQPGGVAGDRASQGAHSQGRPTLNTEYSSSTGHAFSHMGSPTASRPTHSRSNTAEIHGNAVFELPDTPYVSELDSSTLYDPPHGGKKPSVTEYFAPELEGDNTPPKDSLSKLDHMNYSAALPPPPPISSLDSEEKEVALPITTSPLPANNAGPIPDEDGDLPPPPPPKEDAPRRSSIEKNTIPPRPGTPPPPSQ